MLCGTQAQCNKVNTSGGVKNVGTVVKFSDYIKLLGVKLDPAVSCHVTEFVRSCNYHIHALRQSFRADVGLCRDGNTWQLSSLWYIQ